MEIRLVRINDLEVITDIYNEAIKTTTTTLDIQSKPADVQERWFEEHTSSKYPVYAADINELVVSWVSLSPWSKRDAFKDTDKISFYVKAPYQGRGVDTDMMRGIINSLWPLGYHVLIAQIIGGAEASFHINRSLGFCHVGTLREAGKKLGDTLDIHLYNLLLD